MAAPRARGFIRVPTVSAALAIAIGLAFIASGVMVAAFIGVLLLVAGGVELAVDFEQTLVPERVTPPDLPREIPLGSPDESPYEEAGAA